MNKYRYFLWCIILLASIASFGLLLRYIKPPKNSESTNYGCIYDRNNFILAYSSVNYNIYLKPKNITDPIATYQELRPYITYEKYLELLQKDGSILVATTSTKPPKFSSDSILVQKNIKRKYPMGKYSTTIGYLDLSRGICKGVESYAQYGNVQTTIDWRLQLNLALHLEHLVKKRNGEVAFGILLNKNGEIEAMHTTNCADPSYPKDFFIYPTSGLFEIGSVSKAITAFAGLYLGAFTLDTVLDPSTGKYIGSRPMCDTHAPPKEWKIGSILGVSSNIGTVAAAKKIGEVNLMSFFKLLQLHEKILWNCGETPEPTWPKTRGDMLSAAFGYAYSGTFLHFGRAFVSIINDGKLIIPRILLNQPAQQTGRINTTVLPDLQKILKSTAAGVCGEFAKMGVGSKSGTAKQWRGNHYSSSNFNCFFVFFIPDLNGDFKYVLLVSLINPQPPQLSGVVLKDMGISYVSYVRHIMYMDSN